MLVNSSKSRNLVTEKRKILNEDILATMVNKTKCSIPPISEKSVKFLGRTISDSLSDKHQVENLIFSSVNRGLTLINAGPC